MNKTETIYSGKAGKRAYIILPKKCFCVHGALKWVAKYWHTSMTKLILSGADEKSKTEFYVELPYDEGDYYAVYRMDGSSSQIWEAVEKYHLTF